MSYSFFSQLGFLQCFENCQGPSRSCVPHLHTAWLLRLSRRAGSQSGVHALASFALPSCSPYTPSKGSGDWKAQASCFALRQTLQGPHGPALASQPGHTYLHPSAADPLSFLLPLSSSRAPCLWSWTFAVSDGSKVKGMMSESPV